MPVRSRLPPYQMPGSASRSSRWRNHSFRCCFVMGARACLTVQRPELLPVAAAVDHCCCQCYSKSQVYSCMKRQTSMLQVTAVSADDLESFDALTRMIHIHGSMTCWSFLQMLTCLNVTGGGDYYYLSENLILKCSVSKYRCNIICIFGLDGEDRRGDRKDGGIIQDAILATISHTVSAHIQLICTGY